MKKLFRFRQDFDGVELTLLLVVVIIIGGIGWYVRSQRVDITPSNPITNFVDCVAAGNPVMESYPEQCAANGQTYIKDALTQFDIEAAYAVKTVYSKLPDELKVVIFETILRQVPACVKNNQILDSNGQPVDLEVDYAEIGSAVAPIGCDGGSAGLFAKDIYKGIKGKWEFIEKTQSAFRCDNIFSYPVPRKLLELGSEKVECLETTTNKVRSYESAYAVRFL